MRLTVVILKDATGGPSRKAHIFRTRAEAERAFATCADRVFLIHDITGKGYVPMVRTKRYQIPKSRRKDLDP